MCELYESFALSIELKIISELKGLKYARWCTMVKKVLERIRIFKSPLIEDETEKQTQKYSNQGRCGSRSGNHKKRQRKEISWRKDLKINHEQQSGAPSAIVDNGGGGCCFFSRNKPTKSRW